MESNLSPAPVHQVVGQLRDLLDAGTRGPWEAYARTWRFSGKPQDEWHIRTSWIHGQLRDKAGVLARSLHASDDEDDRHGVWLSNEDAVLIVAAVNAMPALLDIAEAAQSVQDGQDMRDDDETEWAAAGTRVSAMEMHDRRMRLARALSSLPNPSDHRADQEVSHGK